MTKNEAIQAVLKERISVYTLSSRVFEATKSYHENDDEKFFDVCKTIVKNGIDIVDDCVEDMYRIVCDIDESGEILGSNDKAILMKNVSDWLREKVLPGEGRLMKCGCIFGILHSQN